MSESEEELQDSILNGLSPQTCELLRSGLPPLDDKKLLRTLPEEKSDHNDDDKCSTPESIISNEKPLEFYSLI